MGVLWIYLEEQLLINYDAIKHLILLEIQVMMDINMMEICTRFNGL